MKWAQHDIILKAANEKTEANKEIQHLHQGNVTYAWQCWDWDPSVSAPNLTP